MKSNRSIYNKMNAFYIIDNEVRI